MGRLWQACHPARLLTVAGLGAGVAASAVALLAAPVWTAAAALAAAALAALSAASLWIAFRDDLEEVEEAIRHAQRLSHALPSAAGPPRPYSRHALSALLSMDERLLSRVRHAQGERAQAEQLDRFEGELMASLSHELRTPLNAIVGFTQVLLDEIDGPLTGEQRESVMMIRSSGEHLRDLVADVLDLAALSAGQPQRKRELVDVGELIEEVASMLRPQAVTKGLAIIVNLDAELHQVVADRRRLHQLLTNLGSNAIKFTSEGQVRFAARIADGSLLLSVVDTGIGIDPDSLELIFEEFGQVGDGRARGQGAGLGLAICRRIALLHAGRIWVESTRGAGSCFTVALPLEEPSLAEDR